MGNIYQVRTPIYQPNQEKLNLKDIDVTLNKNNSAIEKQEDKLIQKSPFVAKIIAQLSF